MTGRTVGVLLVLVSGCDYGGLGSSGSRDYAYDYGYDDGYTTTTRTPEPVYDTGAPDGSEIAVSRAFMAGDMGDVRGFAETPFEVQAYRTEGRDFLRFDAIDSGSGMWVMAQVEIQGGLDHEIFRPGASIELGGYGYGETPGIYASGLGCSGPAVNTFTFDQAPNAMHVEVTSGSLPSHRQFVITLDFGYQLVDVSFEVGPTPAADARISAATLFGSAGGVSVSGETTFTSELHNAGHSTVLLERSEADGRIVRVRLDVDGGLGALAPGSYGLGDAGISLAVSTTSADVDPSYGLAPAALDARVAVDGSGKVLALTATFASGETLHANVFYN